MYAIVLAAFLVLTICYPGSGAGKGQGAALAEDGQNALSVSDKSLPASAIPHTNLTEKNPSARFREGELVVRYKPSVSRDPEVLKRTSQRMIDILMAVKKGTGKPTVIGDLSSKGLPGTHLIKLPEGVGVGEAASVLAKDPDVLYAEPNFNRYPEKIPSDPRFKDQWALYNTGQYVYDTYGQPGADIRAIEAWDTTTGSPDVIIAVLDPAGVMVSHPDLKPNIWKNPREIPGNGIDDDGNGYTDDINGWDFYDANRNYQVETGEGDNNPSPDMMMDDHGTACAGTIGAVANNGIGIAGTMWNVTLMPLKFDGDTWSESAAILYARENGAQIISCSFGNYDYSRIEQDAISGSPDILFVCSAGNDGLNTDINQHYPSGYSDDNLISVAASDQKDGFMRLWTGEGSNYGPITVDLAAPGANILCISPDSTFIYGDGTSLSVPYVAGVAGLILSTKPETTAGELKDAIMNSVVPIPAFSGKTVTGGRLDAASALLAVDTTPRPDIVISSVDAPGSVMAGAEISVRTLVRNAGRADAEKVSVTYYLSKTLVTGAWDLVLGSTVISKIASKETTEITPSLKLPDNTSMGRYYIFARADERDSISESNERNNIQFDPAPMMVSVKPSITPSKTVPAGTTLTPGRTPAPTKTPFPTFPPVTRSLTPTPARTSRVPTPTATVKTVPGPDTPEALRPDLSFSSLWCPEQVAAGRLLVISYSITNLGDTQAKPFIIEFYLSKDQVPDRDDLKVGSQYLNRVKPGVQVRQSVGVGLKTTVQEGPYYLLAVADPAGSSGDTSPGNNVIASEKPLMVAGQ